MPKLVFYEVSLSKLQLDNPVAEDPSDGLKSNCMQHKFTEIIFLTDFLIQGDILIGNIKIKFHKNCRALVAQTKGLR